MILGDGPKFVTDGGYWGYPCLAGSGPGVDQWRECTMLCSSERRALLLLHRFFFVAYCQEDEEDQDDCKG